MPSSSTASISGIPRVLVDGSAGTVGLKLQELLQRRGDLELIILPPEKRKNPLVRKEFYSQADLVIQALPETESHRAVKELGRLPGRILNCSTAFRTDTDWVYGLPELDPERPGLIQAARLVSNPGCFATGFLLALHPLRQAGIIPANYPLSCFGISGYSAGGRAVIDKYENPEQYKPEWIIRALGLDLSHKHLPEMTLYGKLDSPPIFIPSIGNFKQGMLILLPLHSKLLGKKHDAASLRDFLREYYRESALVSVSELAVRSLSPINSREQGLVELFVSGEGEEIILAARLDNLGKGAARAAVQNMNLMLGLDEFRSLT